jgi:hypothetical protein
MLKAFHGAPCWTKQELDLVTTAFCRAGFEIYPPSRKNCVNEDPSEPREEEWRKTILPKPQVRSVKLTNKATLIIY